MSHIHREAKTAALHLWNIGANVTSIGEGYKEPSHDWNNKRAPWATERQPREVVESLPWNRERNVWRGRVDPPDRSEMDVIGAFLEECCLLHPGAKAQSTDLHKAYSAWCETNGEFALKQKAFGQQLDQRGLTSKRTGKGFYRLGVGLLTDRTVQALLPEDDGELPEDDGNPPEDDGNPPEDDGNPPRMIR